jgi:hypothetical protein
MNFVRRICQTTQQHHVIFQIHLDNGNEEHSKEHYSSQNQAINIINPPRYNFTPFPLCSNLLPPSSQSTTLQKALI